MENKTTTTAGDYLLFYILNYIFILNIVYPYKIHLLKLDYVTLNFKRSKILFRV